MRHAYIRNIITTRIWISALLSLFLISCSNDPSSKVSAPAIMPTSRPTSTPSMISTTTPTPAALGLNADKSFNLPPLNIQARGFMCNADYFIPLGTGMPVLTEDPSSYDAGSIAALTQSLDKNDPSLLPNSFAAVLGSFVGPHGAFCFTTWELTNTNQDIVQITKMMLHYTNLPQPNVYQYKLIDYCSLPTSTKSICDGLRGGGSENQSYTFALGPGNASTNLTGSPGRNQSATFTLNPGDTVKVDLNAFVPSGLDQAYIYSIYPEISLSTSSQEETLEVTQMTDTLAFTDIKHISCYQLQGNDVFTQITDPSLVPNPPDYHVDCI